LINKSMKSRLYCCLSIGIPFAITLFYVWSTAADVAFRDDMYLIKGGFVEHYCNGTLTFADLWRPAAYTRILGYNLVQLVNIKCFGMNSKIIVLFIPFLMLGAVLLVYRDYYHSLSPECSSKFITASFIMVSLTIFNLVQWEGLTFSYDFVFQAPMPFFIASFICLELFLTKGRAQDWPMAFILPILAILIFGGTYSFSFSFALGTTFLCYVVTRSHTLTKAFWLRVMIMVVFLAALAFVYMYDIHKNDYFPDSSHHAATVLNNPLQALRFLLAAFGASVVGVNAANIFVPFAGMVAIGLFVVICYGLGLYLFIKSKLYEKSYLPFYLITQSFFYLVFMMIGRFGYGIDYGMASRYTCVSVYGLVGIIWVIIFFLVHSENMKPFQRILLYMPVAVILSGVIVTSIVEWKIQPHRRAYFQNLQEIALRVDTATDEELSKFEERPAVVRQALKVLRDCNLNVYRQTSESP